MLKKHLLITSHTKDLQISCVRKNNKKNRVHYFCKLKTITVNV